MNTKTIMILAMLITPMISSAAMYKYQDEKGEWVYSQHPPASGDFESIRAKKRSRSSVSSKPSSSSNTDKKASKSGSKAGKEIVDKETAKNADKRADACSKSKAGLTALQTYRRFKDKDGNVSRMADDERERRIKSAKQNIQQFCDE